METGKGFGAAHYSEDVSVDAPTSSGVTATVGPHVVPAYNPDRPKLSLSTTAASELVSSPSRGKEGISNIP